MDNNSFWNQHEGEAERIRAGSGDDLSRIFDGVADKQIPYVRANIAFAVLDAFLAKAVDVYGRKGTVFRVTRQRHMLVMSRGSQTVECAHFLDQSAIGFRFIGLLPGDAERVALSVDGFPCTADAWKPRGP